MEPDRLTKVLSRNLRSIRKNKGLTTLDLADLLGVSQAKVSYIENCKGVLSARDVAVLSRKLNIPITQFFEGVGDSEDPTGLKELIVHLVRYGAVLLAKPAGVSPSIVPFEEIFARALGFIDDDRLHKGFCAALITQAGSKEIHVDRIFSLIGDNPFLINKAAGQASLCIEIVDSLTAKKVLVLPRAKRQIEKIQSLASALLGSARLPQETDLVLSAEGLSDLAEFVEDCLNAKG